MSRTTARAVAILAIAGLVACGDGRLKKLSTGIDKDSVAVVRKPTRRTAPDLPGRRASMGRCSCTLPVARRRKIPSPEETEPGRTADGKVMGWGWSYGSVKRHVNIPVPSRTEPRPATQKRPTAISSGAFEYPVSVWLRLVDPHPDHRLLAAPLARNHGQRDDPVAGAGQRVAQVGLGAHRSSLDLGDHIRPPIFVGGQQSILGRRPRHDTADQKPLRVGGHSRLGGEPGCERIDDQATDCAMAGPVLRSAAESAIASSRLRRCRPAP